MSKWDSFIKESGVEIIPDGSNLRKYEEYYLGDHKLNVTYYQLAQAKHPIKQLVKAVFEAGQEAKQDEIKAALGIHAEHCRDTDNGI